MKPWHNKGYIKSIAPEGMAPFYRLVALSNPKNWYREWKWRRQRVKRGWSDKDCWAAGEHIMEVTAGMLRHLESNGSTDWEKMFTHNFSDNMGYSSIKNVYMDIEEYLEREYEGPVGLNYEDARAVKEYHEETLRIYEKASKAMQFVAKNIGMFWD